MFKKDLFSQFFWKFLKNPKTRSSHFYNLKKNFLMRWRFKEGTFFFPGFSQFFVNRPNWAILTSFEDFLLIFGANESWDHPPKNEKLFTPLLVFTPPFLPSKITTLDFPDCILCKFSLAEKGGKNFCFGNYGVSAFFCTKIRKKII